MDAAVVGLVGALGGSTVTGCLAIATERFRARATRASRDVEWKRSAYARFLFLVDEMTRGAIPDAKWMQQRDELGRLRYELVLVVPSLAEHVEALTNHVTTQFRHDQVHGVINFVGGEIWDAHWDPLLNAMSSELNRPRA